MWNGISSHRMTINEPAPSPETPRPPTRKRRRWPWILAAFFGLGLIGQLVNSPHPTLRTSNSYFFASQAALDASDVAITVQIRSTTLEAASHHLAEAIWHAAQTYQQADVLRITITLAKDRWQDKYGYPLTQDLVMGTFSVKRQELEEVRKYRDDTTYAYNEGQEFVYAATLKMMPHGGLLK
jgi:uncharacterized protein YqgV (UPF0045/DUF77 family)